VTRAPSTTVTPETAVVFLHLHKTGGLTLRHVLIQQYPGARLYAPPVSYTAVERYVRGDGPSPVEPGGDHNDRHFDRYEQLSDRERARVRAFVSHFAFGAHERIARPVAYITMLRDPVDRVLSLYHHRVERGGLRLSLPDYLDAGRDFELDNAQTRQLAGSSNDLWLSPCTSEVFAQATRHLDQIAVTGVTERWDESVLLMADRLGWRRVSYVMRNVGTGRPRRDELPAGVVDRILERNRFDAELHSLARARLAMQLDATYPDLERSLGAFRRTAARWAPINPVLERARHVAYLAARKVSRRQRFDGHR
jgi:hypothetical protein